ncbi:Outer membrane lipoprotein blc precursor (plasmid) [Tsukamurella tyrosinosolvens]|uniref:Apolipoprotein D and lipocalin family protein n=1 Tax=Tsukamurella tyrosinosolvens TaxID=57704 RepID=A0A1H5A725_TSUTY|nr:lipocalin family protein [Tsukamurella tyrosinosolvens]KXO95425.1 lipocalin [Tsukamurella tyrosinosolvens]RDB46069.1 lipocalin [Tsukamurella tyrosinosolvens]SED37905.1 apolipoprotein D and lipocalin family protein [Tsukamurella tyrosinosolvens]VEH99357.1 Outer membrane lipoprotein blc precursor [Tsukamurella tyrosinosolvens]
MIRTARSTALALTAAVAVTGAVAAPAVAAPLGPVAKVDVARYVGTWHQLAAIPAPFSAQCARDTTATYRIVDATNVSVHNTCTTWTGSTSSIRGNARVTDPRTTAQLHVSFPGVPTQEALDGPPNYVVAALAPDYSWAFVGDPARRSAFVLSRTSAVPAARWAQVRATAERLGYNACTILSTPTTGGLERIAPLCALP